MNEEVTSFEIYDQLGQLAIASKINQGKRGNQELGVTHLASGVYSYVVRSGAVQLETGKLLIVK